MDNGCMGCVWASFPEPEEASELLLLPLPQHRISAYLGAAVGELIQLRVVEVEEEGGLLQKLNLFLLG